MSDIDKATAAAIAEPGKVVTLDNQESFDEAAGHASALLGLPVENIQGFVVIGVDQNDNYLIMGNVAAPEGEHSDALGMFLLGVVQNACPDLLPELFARTMLGGILMGSLDDEDAGAEVPATDES